MSLPEAIVSWSAPTICEAWAAAALAIQNHYEALIATDPLPLGPLTAKIGAWHFMLNNSDEISGGLPPYSIRGRNDEAGAACLLRMRGGSLTNYTEDRFLADLYLASIAQSFRPDPQTGSEREARRPGD